MKRWYRFFSVLLNAQEKCLNKMASKDYPLYCPKRKQESLIKKKLQAAIIKEMKKGSATERCIYANGRYLYMITRHPIIKTAAIS